MKHKNKALPPGRAKSQTFDLVKQSRTQGIGFSVRLWLARVIRDIFQYIAGLTMKHLTNFVKRPNGKLLDSAKTDC